MDYKKILEGIVSIIHTTEKSDIGFANICTYIGENCPELAETEDERIRQALLEYFGEECDTATINGIYCYKIYNWLEKQGETSSVLSNSLNTGKRENKGNEGKISPKWTDEDEVNWSGIIDEIEANKSEAPDYDFETYDRFLSWLDNIKQRLGGEE